MILWSSTHIIFRHLARKVGESSFKQNSIIISVKFLPIINRIKFNFTYTTVLIRKKSKITLKRHPIEELHVKKYK